MVRLVNNLVDNAPKFTSGDLFGGKKRSKDQFFPGPATSEPLAQWELHTCLQHVPEHTYLEHPYPGIERRAFGELRIMRELTNPMHGKFFADVHVDAHADGLFAIIAKLPWWLRQLLGGQYVEDVSNIQKAIKDFEVNQFAEYESEEGFDGVAWNTDWLWLDTTHGEVRMKFQDFQNRFELDHQRKLWIGGYNNLRRLLRHSPFYDPSLEPEEIPI